MTYPETVDRFVEKLNKADTVYVIEDEELVLEDGVFEGELAHDNVKNESVMVFTGPKMSGERIENFFLSIPSNAPWKRIIKVFANAPKVYVTYETTGDQVEAEDINRVQESIANTQKEVERYKAANDQAVSDLGTRLSTVESKKADKTYVDTELLKKADKENIYTKAETDSRIQAIIGAAPEALDTLAEIAEALNNDPDFAATITNMLAQKVDKVAGMGLSEANFTNEEKTKLSNIEEGANKYIHPSTHPASMIVESADKQFVSATDKAKWDAKETPEGAQEKANAAETNAKTYADSIKPTKVSELENDENFVTQEELGNAGYGDMLKSVYDTDNDGKVDMAEAADSVPWDGVTGKPGTFPPSSHNHDDRYIKNTGGTIQNGDLYMDGGSVNYIRPVTTGGWARGFWWSKRDLTKIGGIGVLGNGETISKFYIGYGTGPWSNSIVEIYPSYINVNGEIKQQGQTVLLKGQPLTWNDLKGE